MVNAGADQPSEDRDDGARGAAHLEPAPSAQLEPPSLLTSIIAHIPSGIFWKGRDFKYLGCNEAFARSAGVRADDIVGKTDFDLAWEQDQAAYFRSCDRQVMEQDRPLLNIEEIERQADGRQAILLTSKVPLHDKTGQVCGVLGIDTDITHLKQVENELRQMRAELEFRVRERTAELSAANEQLRHEIAERERVEKALVASEERHRLVSQLTSDYAYAVRVEAEGACRPEWVTDALSHLIGGGPETLDSRGIWDRLVHPDDLPIVERRIKVLLAGCSVVNEFRIVGRSGEVRWVRDHARPVWDESEGRVVRILGAAQDISERKQAEEETRRHQAALAQVARLSTMGEMAAQLAHELNQPLCTMMGNAQTAQRLLASPEPDMAELRGALDDIVTFGRHAATVIRRLREFLRQQQPQPVLLNVQRMIEEIVGFVEVDARQHDARVRFELADDLPAIRGDGIRLQQVLLNLVRNALEALGSGNDREVVISARRGEPDGLVISVSDSGPGLSPGAEQRVFEPFFTTKPGGLGLGLAISRSVVEAHGGRLSVEPGGFRGATFSMLLPACPEGA